MSRAACTRPGLLNLECAVSVLPAVGHVAAPAGAPNLSHRGVGSIEIAGGSRLGDVGGASPSLLGEANGISGALLLPVVLDLLERGFHGLGFRCGSRSILGRDTLRHLALGGHGGFHETLIVGIALRQEHKENNGSDERHQDFNHSHQKPPMASHHILWRTRKSRGVPARGTSRSRAWSREPASMRDKRSCLCCRVVCSMRVNAAFFTVQCFVAFCQWVTTFTFGWPASAWTFTRNRCLSGCGLYIQTFSCGTGTDA